MTMFVIEKGVPIPSPQKNGPGATPKYPWRDMDVGDSFRAAVPAGVTKARFHSHISAVACGAAKRINAKFATRVEGECLRVWRVA